MRLFIEPEPHGHLTRVAVHQEKHERATAGNCFARSEHSPVVCGEQSEGIVNGDLIFENRIISNDDATLLDVNAIGLRSARYDPIAVK